MRFFSRAPPSKISSLWSAKGALEKFLGGEAKNGARWVAFWLFLPYKILVTRHKGVTRPPLIPSLQRAIIQWQSKKKIEREGEVSKRTQKWQRSTAGAKSSKK